MTHAYTHIHHGHFGLLGRVADAFFHFFFLVLACFLEVVEGRLFRLSVMGISVELTDTFISVSMTLT